MSVRASPAYQTTRPRWRREWREWVLFGGMVGPNLAFLLVFVFWPLVYNAYLSLVEWDFIAPVKVFIGLENYREALRDPLFHQVLWNSLVFTVGTVAGTLVLGLLAALLLNQPLVLRHAARSVLFSPYILPGAAVAVVWVYIFDPTYGLVRLLLHPLGLTSPNWLRDPRWAMLALIVVYVWKHVGYTLVIFLAGLQAIPRDLYEAALIDGAGAWARFRFVTLPGLSPITFFLVVTGILSSFQAFDLIHVMTRGGPVNATNTLLYHLYEEGFVAFHAGRAGVVAVVLFLLLLLVTVVQVRYGERRVHYA